MAEGVNEPKEFKLACFPVVVHSATAETLVKSKKWLYAFLLIALRPQCSKRPSLVELRMISVKPMAYLTRIKQY